jgi:hypothetical protein
MKSLSGKFGTNNFCGAMRHKCDTRAHKKEWMFVWQQIFTCTLGRFGVRCCSRSSTVHLEPHSWTRSLAELIRKTRSTSATTRPTVSTSPHRRCHLRSRRSASSRLREASPTATARAVAPIKGTRAGSRSTPMNRLSSRTTNIDEGRFTKVMTTCDCCVNKRP